MKLEIESKLGFEDDNIFEEMENVLLEISAAVEYGYTSGELTTDDGEYRGRWEL